jgi:hypothetical protein
VRIGGKPGEEMIKGILLLLKEFFQVAPGFLLAKGMIEEGLKEVGAERLGCLEDHLDLRKPDPSLAEGIHHRLGEIEDPEVPVKGCDSDPEGARHLADRVELPRGINLVKKEGALVWGEILPQFVLFQEGEDRLLLGEFANLGRDEREPIGILTGEIAKSPVTPEPADKLILPESLRMGADKDGMDQPLTADAIFKLSVLLCFTNGTDMVRARFNAIKGKKDNTAELFFHTCLPTGCSAR